MRTDLTSDWGDFLSPWHWQVFATATFTVDVTFEYARAAARRWLAWLGPQVYAYVAPEEGTHFDRVHFHALIGGLFVGGRDASRLGLRNAMIARAKTSWEYHNPKYGKPIRGNITIAPYDPRRGAAWYIAKCPEDSEIVGVLQRHRRRAA